MIILVISRTVKNMSDLRQLFQSFKWNPNIVEELPFIEITILHRGAPNDQRKFRYEDIIRLDGNFMVLLNEMNEEVYIPFHRILLIENTHTGYTYYQNRKLKEEGFLQGNTDNA
jgi:uncharacterized protein (UPF0248 family)